MEEPMWLHIIVQIIAIVIYTAIVEYKDRRDYPRIYLEQTVETD